MKTSHIMCASKILTYLCFRKQKNQNKKYFWKSCLQCLSSKNVLAKYKGVWLSINGAQFVRLENGTMQKWY